MFSGNEWVILIIVMGVLLALPVLIIAVVLGARRGRGRGREIQATSPVMTNPMQQGPAPGWYPDPTGRHEQRYWDRATWTDAVVSNGQPATGPI